MERKWKKYPKEIKNRRKGVRKWENCSTRSNCPIIGLLKRENRDNGGKETFKERIQETLPELGPEFPDWKVFWVPSKMDENKCDHAIWDTKDADKIL